MTIDSHFHCWQLARGDYGWLTEASGSIHRDVSVNEWQAKCKPLGVTGGVLVQAAATESETRFLLSQADAHTAVLGVVGWADLLAADAPDRIRSLAKHPKLKGLRPMLQDLDKPEWILQAALGPALRTMVECDLAFDALVKPEHLPHILQLALAYPQMRIVIDHCAKPDIANQLWQPWADDMALLAAETSVMCKLSGLLTQAGPPPQASAMRRWALHVLHSFGLDRVLWGSDWPVLELAGSYRSWWAETQALLHGFSAIQQAAMLGGNARQFYKL
jgi:L-fuconolactonase